MSERTEPLRDGSEESTPSGRDAPANNATENISEDGETQRSLQQASIALEVALSRIVEVRRSLLQLSQSLPRPNAELIRRFELDLSQNIGPTHDAILLAGDATPTFNTTRWLPDSRDLPPPPPPRNASNRPRPPIAPGRPPMAEDGSARRRVRPPQLHPEYAGADSAATTRGLRVAAREANPNARDYPLDFSILTQEYDDILGSMGLNSSPPARLDQTRGAPQSLEGFYASRSREPAPDQRRAPLTQNSTSTSWRSPDPRRWRLRQHLTPAFIPLPRNHETQSLPALANMAIQANDGASLNTILGGDVGVRGGRVHAPLTGPLYAGMLSLRSESIAERFRVYQESMLADSMSNDVNIDWSDDDFISWLFPSHRERPPAGGVGAGPPEAWPRRPERPPNGDVGRTDAGGAQHSIQVTRTTETQLSPPDRAVRRRGWARLDADGNEIPPDEEQELERSRTEYRLRALQQARRQAAPPPSSQGRYSELPMGTFYHEQAGNRVFHGSVLDSTLVVQNAERHRPSSSVSGPMYVDPLPMPLASMVIDNRRTSVDCPKDILVPTDACLAGR